MKKELVSGHLQVKGGKYYVVLYLPQSNGKKKAKWISTHLDERGNKTRAEVTSKIRKRRVFTAGKTGGGTRGVAAFVSGYVVF